MRYLITILLVSILLVAHTAEAKRRSSVTIRHDGYDSNRNRSTHRIIPTVPLNQGNRISNYPETPGWVGTFPTRTTIPRRER